MTLYEILEVSEKASNEVIEKAYKTLAKKYHPDLQQTPEQAKTAEQKMKQINEAYAVLKDENKRREYDIKLQQKASSNSSQYTQYTQPSQTATYNQQNYGYRTPAEWQQILSSLPPNEREKLKRKIERDAREEYTRVAEDYYRQQGYRVIHKTTLKEHISRLIAIGIMLIICVLLWIIPFTRRWLQNLYETNIAIKMLVDIVINLVKSLFGITQ